LPGRKLGHAYRPCKSAAIEAANRRICDAGKSCRFSASSRGEAPQIICRGTGEPLKGHRRYRAMRFAQSDGQHWNEQERQEIGRLHRTCDRAGYFDLECSHTDEGDPWCIVYERRRQRIVVHIARIDRRYVVVFPLESRSSWMTTIGPAIDLAIAQIATEPVRGGEQ
jgi:hypothetical protein